MEKTNKRSFFKSKVFILIFAILFIAIIIFLAVDASKKRKIVSEWEDKIYPGVTMCDIDFGGKTREEAEAIIKNDITLGLANKIITIKVGDKAYQYKYSDFNTTIEYNESLDKAIKYGKNLDNEEQYNIIKSGDSYVIDIPVVYDKSKMEEIKEKVIQDSQVEAKNASISVKNGKIEIIPEVNGVIIDREKLQEALSNAFNSKKENENIDMEYTKKEAKVKKEDLSVIKPTPMATFQTNYASSSFERATNIEIATSLVNGTVLMPGEIFSYSETSQKGRGRYKDAPVYINNKVEMAEAGGICQVSTTLYRAVMKANIRSVERFNHSLPVGYAQKGLDATVAWGSLDYKFKNTYDFPIYIEGITQDRNVIFNIYGNPDALGGKTYDMQSEVVEEIQSPINYVDDSQLYEGTTEVISQGSAGCKVKAYQITYENGVEINREVVSTDTYAATPTYIKRGTKPKETINIELEDDKLDKNSEDKEE